MKTTTSIHNKVTEQNYAYLNSEVIEQFSNAIKHNIIVYGLLKKIVLFEYFALVKSFFKLGGCLWLLMKLHLPNIYFVCSVSCSKLKTERTVGNKLILIVWIKSGYKS